MGEIEMGRKDALIIVDAQNDFFPGGALEVPAGDEIVPVLNRLIDKAVAGGSMIVASRDWHPRGHVSFEAQGGQWPPHCVAGTKGAEFHPDLRLPENVVVITKGDRPDSDQYSAFDRTGLAELLRRAGVERLWVGGLAEDVCVFHTVKDARKEGFEVHLIADATRPVNVREKDGLRAEEEMRAAGAIIE